MNNSNENNSGEIVITYQFKRNSIEKQNEEQQYLKNVLAGAMDDMEYSKFNIVGSSDYMKERQQAAEKIKGFYNNKLIAYRGVILGFFVCLFNIIESLYFGQGTELGFNRRPMSVAEFICDSLCFVGAFLAIVMSSIDLLWFKARLSCAVERKVNKEKKMEE
ncbi:MAG: hypothetical protein AB9836_04610 [Aminipila sp.]